MTTATINTHPADELAAIRAEIKQLQDREGVLRNALMSGSEDDRDGRNYRAFIAASKRESIDKDAIVAAFGRAAIEPYIKATEIKSLKLAKKETDDL